MTTKTADLCDQYRDRLQVLDPVFRSYGARRDFSGQVVTVNVHEDNVLVRAALEKDGAGQVLVIDGGGSVRSALVGGNIAKLAADNHWNGMVIYGCIRDSTEVAAIDIGVVALATCPVKPKKNGFGETDIPVRFAGAMLSPGDYVYVDEDGVVVAREKLD